MSSSEKNISFTIKSVDNALTLLEVLSELDDGINLSSLSDQLGMTKSGVYRMLQAFKQRGYVEQRSRHGQYHLGLAAYMMGQKISSKARLSNVARPLMESLVKDHNETVYLTVCNDRSVLFLENVESKNAVSVKSLSGRLYPVDECASGHVLMANSEDSVEKFQHQESLTSSQLEDIYKQGYAVDKDLLDVGVVSVAVPLLQSGGMVIGSLCVVGPDFRLSPEVINNLLPSLITASLVISSKLGYDKHRYFTSNPVTHCEA